MKTAFLILGTIVALFVVLSSEGSAQSKDQAIRLFEQAEKLAETARSDQDWQGVAKKYEQASRIFKTLRDRKHVADTAMELGNVYGRLRQWDKALAQYGILLDVAKELHDPDIEAAAHFGQGKVRTLRAKAASEPGGGHFAEMLIPGLEKLGKQKVWISNVDNEAILALDHLEKALEIYTRRGSLKWQNETLRLISLTYKKLGEENKALEYHKKAQAIQEKSDRKRPETDRTDQSRGRERFLQLYNEAEELRKNSRSKSNLEAALRKFEMALGILKEVGRTKGVEEVIVLNRMGQIYFSMEDKGRAELFLKASLQLSEQIKDDEGTALNLGHLGQLCEDSGSDREAAHHYKRLLELIPKIGWPARKEVETLKSLGSIHWRTFEYEKSRAYFEKCLKLSRKIQDKEYEGASLNGIAGVLKEVGSPAEAEKYYQEALRRSKEDGDRVGQATVLHNLGALHSLYGKHFGEYKKAADYLEEALAIGRSLPDQSIVMHCLIELSGVQAHMGEWEKAVQGGKAAVELSAKHGNLRERARALQQYGTMCITLYALGPAETYLEQSLQLSQQVNDLGQQELTYNELGEVYRKSGRYYDAIRCYKKSLEIQPENNPTPLNNLGMVYADLGRHTEALKYYRASLSMMEKFGRIDVQGITHINIATMCQKLGHDDEALEHYRKAHDICRATGVDASRPLGSMGMLFLERGLVTEAEEHVLKKGDDTSLYAARIFLAKTDFERARRIYEQRIQMADVSGDMDLRFMTYTGAGLASEGMGDLTSARDYLAKSIEITEDLRSSLRLEERQTFFDVSVSSFFCRTDPYKGLARLLLKMGQPSESLRVSELVKARVFAEAMAQAFEGKQTDMPDELLKRGDEIQDSLENLKKQRDMAHKSKNESAAKSIEPRITDLENKRSAHVKMLREKYPLFAATRYPEPMDLSQTALKVNEWALEYDVTDSGLLIYLTKGREIVSAIFKPVPNKVIDRLIRNFRKTVELAEGETVRDKVTQFDFATGKKLADLLLGDVLPDLPKDVPLIIVPDGQLGVIPFEMLVLNDGGRIATDKGCPYVIDAELFGDRNPISYYQSITALTLARQFRKQREAGQKVLVIDDPIFGPDDPRVKDVAQAKKQKILAAAPDTLMAAKEELGLHWYRLPLTAKLGESLEKLFPGRTDRYTGVTATKQVVLQQPLTQFGSIVFATHGYFGKNLPQIQEPVLALTFMDQPKGDDGLLKTSDVMKLKMSADIVALTACMSGLGAQISGEGTMGMGRAFQYAGARSVLMSLWSVSENSSVMLVESFFNHLKVGRSKLEALGLAREEIRKAGYDHPFYWASFILVGEIGDSSAADVAPPPRRGPVRGSQAQPGSELVEENRTAGSYTVSFDVADSTVSVKLAHGNETVATRNIAWNKHELENRVRTFLAPFRQVESINESLKAFDPYAAKVLFTELLSDALEKAPRGAHVRIHPPPILAQLPFEVLTTGGVPQWNESDHSAPQVTGLTYVGDLYQISYAESEGSSRRTHRCEGSKDRGERILVMADPVFSTDDSRVAEVQRRKRQELPQRIPFQLMSMKEETDLAFPRLPLTGQLAESLKKSAPGRTDLYTGMAASKQTLVGLDLCRYSTIVFATHGYFGKDLPAIVEPVMVLTLLDQPEGHDGFLRASEVSALRLKADLVVLIADQSGLGPLVPGRGIVSMGKSFLDAGAKSVLVSLWPVSEKCSVLLAESFLQHLCDGRNKLDALQLAREEVRKAGYDHPFFWAPFILVGEVD